MHTLIVGASGSGKTVAALRAVTEITNNLGMGAIVLDWKKDWRVLLHTTLDKSRFKFFSLGNPNVNPIRLNLLAIPKNVDPEVWRDTFTEAFCLAYGLGPRGYTLINQALTSLYDEARVMENPNNSKKITIGSLLERLKETMNSMGKEAGFDTKDAFQRILDRLQQYQFGRLKEMYGTPEDALSINDIVDGNRIVVLEGLGLDSFQKQFIIGLISAGVFLYGSNNNGFHKEGGKLLVFEEAHQVVKGKADSVNLVLDIPETIYEIMFNEARGLGLNLIAISQQPSHMPDSVIANCSNLIALRLAREDDVTVITEAMAKDAKKDNRDIKRWLMRALVGWALIRLGRQFTDLASSEPVLVKIDPLDVTAPSDYELNESSVTNDIDFYLNKYFVK
jgi:DNA helicase HerA-like ATPase